MKQFAKEFNRICKVKKIPSKVWHPPAFKISGPKIGVINPKEKESFNRKKLACLCDTLVCENVNVIF